MKQSLFEPINYFSDFHNNYCILMIKTSNNISNIIMYSITAFKYLSHIFVAVGILTVALCLLVLYFDIAIPNELKGFIFFAQVILNCKQCLV